MFVYFEQISYDNTSNDFKCKDTALIIDSYPIKVRMFFGGLGLKNYIFN